MSSLPIRCVLAGSLWVLGAACAHPAAGPLPPSSPSPLLNQALPTFRHATLQGATLGLDQAAGRVIVVDFFADYCRPCHALLPSVQALHRAHPEVVVVGVSLDPDESIARRTVARHGLDFPIIVDSGNVIAGRFRVTDLPITFVAGRDGVIRWVGRPGQPPGALERVVAATCEGQN